MIPFMTGIKKKLKSYLPKFNSNPFFKQKKVTPKKDHLSIKKRERAGTYASSLSGSTIGAAGCHGRVRDGNGWSPGAWPACSETQYVKKGFDVGIAERGNKIGCCCMLVALLAGHAPTQRSCKPYKRKPVALLVRLG